MVPLLHAGPDLAIRLERAAAAMSRDAVQAHRALFTGSTAETVPFGDGVAAFVDETSPLTQVRGVGAGQVTSADVDEMEAFFTERMAPVTIAFTPFADAALLTQLSRRGYEFGAFENTLARFVLPEDAAEIPDVAAASDAEEWSRLMAEAFFGEVSPSGIALGRTLQALQNCKSLLVRAGAEPAAGAQVYFHDGVAMLQCDGTRAAYRGEGLQLKLILARLALAAAAGCDLATADTIPGSQSQRNYEKLGFRVAYTKTTLIKPCF